ncbi:hypothetical protein NECAME_12374 [Necator americanus]|uniref:Uncharacterized protein n=1 Tax=Necator americanus TaxID=51031 RepID=W2T0M4_NECAM|nr:hypothetical protein NECAME_12374 [Necator americanus]ETN75448.1 hypothetical protein NECAME_12374 [Necator americanus]
MGPKHMPTAVAENIHAFAVGSARSKLTISATEKARILTIQCDIAALILRLLTYHRKAKNDTITSTMVSSLSFVCFAGGNGDLFVAGSGEGQLSGDIEEELACHQRPHYQRYHEKMKNMYFLTLEFSDMPVSTVKVGQSLMLWPPDVITIRMQRIC